MNRWSAPRRLWVLGIGTAAAIVAIYYWLPYPSRTFLVMQDLEPKVILSRDIFDSIANPQGPGKQQSPDVVLRLGRDVGITAEQHPILIIDDELVEIHGRKNNAFELSKLSRNVRIHGFSVDADGAVWVLSSEGVGTIERGELKKIVDSTFEFGTSILVSKQQKTVFLAGRHIPDRGGWIIAVRDNGTAEYLLESHDVAVMDICEVPHGLLVATPKEILLLRGTTVSLVARLGKRDMERRQRILSVAYSPATNTVFYATEDKIFAVKGFDAISLARGLGGKIRYVNGSLYALDYDRVMLVQLGNVDLL
jgi:hypothetical protein